MADPLFDQPRILLEGGAEKGLTRQEHDDKLGRSLELLPVGLRAEASHVVPHLARMVGQAQAPDLIVGRLNRLQVGLQGRFCIHHHPLAAGKFHDEVRPQPAIARMQRFLLGKIAVGKHARDLDHAPQLNLSPASADRRRPQRLHQIASFVS